MQTDPYFKIPAISNSGLSAVSRQLRGEPEFFCKQETLDFGNQLHEALFEPEYYQSKLDEADPLYTVNKYKIENMVKSMNGNTLYSLLRNDFSAKLEQVHQWSDDRYGLACKGKIDLWVRKIIGDAKSTDCTSLDQFRASIFEYGYDRQAAFYMDGTGAEKFIFFGICKKSPFKTYTVIFKIDDEAIIEARKKYENLIDQYLSIKQKEQNHDQSNTIIN